MILRLGVLKIIPVIICIVVAFSLISCSDTTDPVTVNDNDQISEDTATVPIKDEGDNQSINQTNENNTQADGISEEILESEKIDNPEQEFDFRNVKWGMDQTSVEESEGMLFEKKCPAWGLYTENQSIFGYKANEVKYFFNTDDKLYCIEIKFDDDSMHGNYMQSSIEKLNEQVARAYCSQTPGQPIRKWSEYDEIQYPTIEKQQWLQSRGHIYNRYTLWEIERSEIYTATKTNFPSLDTNAIIVFKSRIIPQFPDEVTHDAQEGIFLDIEELYSKYPGSVHVIDRKVVQAGDTEPPIVGVQPKFYETKGSVNIREGPSISARAFDALLPSIESRWFLWEKRFKDNDEIYVLMYGVESDGYTWIPIVRYDDSRQKIEKNGWVALEVVELLR